MKSKSASKIKLTSYDDLIGGAVSKDDIQEIPIGQLRDFVNHPFHVNDDDEMNELVEQFYIMLPLRLTSFMMQRYVMICMEDKIILP